MQNHHIVEREYMWIHVIKYNWPVSYISTPIRTTFSFNSSVPRGGAYTRLLQPLRSSMNTEITIFFHYLNLFNYFYISFLGLWNIQS